VAAEREQWSQGQGQRACAAERQTNRQTQSRQRAVESQREPERETHIQTEGATGSQREPERARERF
jgi:hypothetical protein